MNTKQYLGAFNNISLNVHVGEVRSLDSSWHCDNVRSPFTRLYYVKSGNGYIETEKERMKAYLAENRQVKTATFSNKRGAVIATSEIGLLHRGKANADQLVQEGIGRVLEVLSNTAVRRVFAYEMDNMNKPITAPYVAKKCDISPDEAAEALELLTEIHVNHLTEVMLDENNSVRMYALNSDECIMYMLMVLKTARLIDENKQHYFNYRGSYNNLWIQ